MVTSLHGKIALTIMRAIGVLAFKICDRPVLGATPKRTNMTMKMCVVIVILTWCTLGCSGGSALGHGGQQEGFVTNGDIKIRYKLDLPEGGGPFPAVVFGPGSGNISADFRKHVAQTKELLELGFAVMRYDKRGTGESELQQLLQMPDIDTDRVGLFGVSQATWYMPLVAESAAEVGFMIVLTGGVMPVGINIRYEILSPGRLQHPTGAVLGWPFGDVSQAGDFRRPGCSPGVPASHPDSVAAYARDLCHGSPPTNPIIRPTDTFHPLIKSNYTNDEI